MTKTRMPRVSGHCLNRVLERTDKARDRNEARVEVQRILRSGRRFGWGRGKWASYLALRDGCILVEDARDPATALIVGNGVVLTCITEAMYLNNNDAEVEHG
jgi:hypothetical protein